MSPESLSVNDDQGRSVARAVAVWLALRHGLEATALDIELESVERLSPGRPGLLDVVARHEERSVHVVLGVRRPGDDDHFLRPTEEMVLGVFDDESGLGVLVDALHDGELAHLLLRAVMGHDDVTETVAYVESSARSELLSFDDRWTLEVFHEVAGEPNPAVDLLMGLDEAGFNHLAAPVARWQRAGRDLGIVQEVTTGRADGWSLALVSFRDLFGSGVAPENAGGDFAPEAHALGTMTGRMHVALDRAFGRRGGSVTGWMDEVEQVVNEADPGLLSKSGADKAIAALREARLSGTALRTHGDFHLGRTARTDQGWVLADCEPGGQPTWADAPLYRSPLADVADMVWSFHHVAGLAAQEREPDDSGVFRASALAWESRNRRAFMVGYLAVPGIGGLVPTDRDVIRNLAAVFEIERAARLSLLDASV